MNNFVYTVKCSDEQIMFAKMKSCEKFDNTLEKWSLADKSYDRWGKWSLVKYKWFTTFNSTVNTCAGSTLGLIIKSCGVSESSCGTGLKVCSGAFRAIVTLATDVGSVSVDTVMAGRADIAGRGASVVHVSSVPTGLRFTGSLNAVISLWANVTCLKENTIPYECIISNQMFLIF